MTAPLTNWAGNIQYSTSRLSEPRSVAELQHVFSSSRHLRVLGTGHSFNRIADTPGVLVSLRRMPLELEINPSRTIARVSANWLLADLSERLHQHGLALHTLPSLPHVSVAGACTTATHGSGTSNGSLANLVRGLTFITADGSRIELTQEDDGFDGAVVSLGLLGVLTHLDLAVEPSYDIEQYVYENLPWSVLTTDPNKVLSSAHSVSVFLDWTHPVRTWVKRRTDQDRPNLTRTGATKADGPRHPVVGMSPANCTEQLGLPGPWHERLPHFRPGITPASGNELQAEYFIPANLTAEALHQLQELQPLLTPILHTTEIRTLAADRAWLSPAHGTDSTAIGFSWHPNKEAVRTVLPRVEAALAPLAPRPHWAKLFLSPAALLRNRYTRWGDFARLRDTYDPHGKFQNSFTAALFTT